MEDGSTIASADYNMARAEKCYFCHQQVLTNRTLPICKRLRAWYASPATVAINNAESWHLTVSLLSKIQTWELQYLRRLLRLRRRPEENYCQYNVRTATIIRKWCNDCGVVMTYMRVLQAVFKASFKEKC